MFIAASDFHTSEPRIILLLSYGSYGEENVASHIFCVSCLILLLFGISVARQLILRIEARHGCRGMLVEGQQLPKEM